MSILWCGGEDIDFPNGGPVYITTISTYYNALNARCALGAGSSSFLESTTFSPISSGWLHFLTYKVSNIAGLQLIGLCDSSTGKGIWLREGVSDSTKVELSKYDGATYTSLAVSSEVFNITSKTKFDMQITDLGVNSNIKVYMNSTLIIDFTGDSSLGVTLDSVFLYGYSSNPSYKAYMSEIIVADEDTRLMSLKTLVPDSAGDASDWTNGYASIDEITNSDADTVYTDVADENFQCNVTGRPAGDFISKGIKIAARMTDGVGGMGVKMGVKTNNTLDLGDTITLDPTWKTYEKLYQNNPVTSNRFTAAEAEALQVAFQSVAL